MSRITRAWSEISRGFCCVRPRSRDARHSSRVAQGRGFVCRITNCLTPGGKRGDIGRVQFPSSRDRRSCLSSAGVGWWLAERIRIGRLNQISRLHPTENHYVPVADDFNPQVTQLGLDQLFSHFFDGERGEQAVHEVAL